MNEGESLPYLLKKLRGLHKAEELLRLLGLGENFVAAAA